MNRPLADFYNHLNKAVITTNDFADGTLFRRRDKVEQFAYCGLNQIYRSYLSFDLDYPGAGRRFEELHIPPPSIVTTNKANGHSHYLYRLITPVAFHKSSRSQPQDYFEAIEAEMTKRLKADSAFTHLLTKNPLHSRWIVETFGCAYHLSDFTEYFDLPSSNRNETPEKSGIGGRNNELFNTLRRWAYLAIHDHSNEDAWHMAVHDHACQINLCFSRPLPPNEVKFTARATAKWVWKHRYELSAKPRKLQFTDETPLERMKAGAEFTNAKRKEESLIILKKAVDELAPIYGKELSPRLLAVHTGQNIKTVRKYLPLTDSPK